MLLIRHLVFSIGIFLFLSLTGCQKSPEFIPAPKGQPDTTLSFTPSAPIEIRKESEASAVANAAAWRSLPAIGTVDMGDMPFFREAWSAQDFRPNRAYVLGVPASCGGRWQSYGFSDLNRAVVSALTNCLKSQERTASHRSETNCTCRLGIVNKQLLINPKEFPQEWISVATLKLKGSESDETTIRGHVVLAGSDPASRAWRMIDRSGGTICHGNLKQTATAPNTTSRRLEVNCQFSNDAISSPYQSKTLSNPTLPNSNGPIGYVSAKLPDGREMTLLVGVTEENFDRLVAEFK